jgi:hypothetical protein
MYSIEKLELIQTCEVSPEQYDLIIDGNTRGYLRLRHGHFRAHAYGSEGPVVYEADTIGDGMFDPNERGFHIGNAIGAILTEIG